MKNLKFSILAAATIIFATSCSKNDVPVPVNEEEVITTVITTLTGGGATVTLTSKDADGDGPTAPVVSQVGVVKKATAYTGTVKFLNDLKTPADDFTVEVLAEGVDHQVFYQAPAGLGAFAYADTDLNGKPIGLKFTLNTSTTANAIAQDLTVILKHLPAKSAADVAGGSITNAGGATDASVTYPVVLVN